MSACLVEFSSYMKSPACLGVEKPLRSKEFPRQADVPGGKRAMTISEYFPNIKKLADRLCKAISKVIGLLHPRATGKREEIAATGATQGPPAPQLARQNVEEQVPGTSDSNDGTNGDDLRMGMACTNELSNENQQPENQVPASDNQSWGWDPQEFDKRSDQDIAADWTFGVDALQDPAGQS